jgi:hypothetical protein
VSRTFNVTAGDKEYATARVTERNGKSLDATTWEVGVGTGTTRPTAWSAGVLLETVSASVVRVGLLIGAGGYTTTGTKLYLWVKPTDAPETFAVRVGTNAFEIV